MKIHRAEQTAMPPDAAARFAEIAAILAMGFQRLRPDSAEPENPLDHRPPAERPCAPVNEPESRRDAG